MQSEDDGILTCVKVINAACLSSEGLDRLLQFFEIGRSLKSLNDRHLEPVAQSMVSGIISDIQERDGHWLVLVRTEVPLGGGNGLAISVLPAIRLCESRRPVLELQEDHAPRTQRRFL